MARADCETCDVLGYRSCDLCGGIVFRAHAGLPDHCYTCDPSRFDLDDAIDRALGLYERD